MLKEVHDECQQHTNWHTVISNPCFEIWLLYHTAKDLSSINTTTSQDCKTSLDSQSSRGYDPERYIVLIKDAMKNAKVADNSSGWYPQPNNTKMYELVEALMKFVSIKEFDDFVTRMQKKSIR